MNLFMGISRATILLDSSKQHVLKDQTTKVLYHRLGKHLKIKRSYLYKGQGMAALKKLKMFKKNVGILLQ